MIIYVRLLDEPVDVWRPVEAALVYGRVYRISAQPYEREIEKWQFEPEQEVECDEALKAIRLVNAGHLR